MYNVNTVNQIFEATTDMYDFWMANDMTVEAKELETTMIAIQQHIDSEQTFEQSYNNGDVDIHDAGEILALAIENYIDILTDRIHMNEFADDAEAFNDVMNTIMTLSVAKYKIESDIDSLKRQLLFN